MPNRRLAQVLQARLDTPEAQADIRSEDLDPSNVDQIDQQLKRYRPGGPQARALTDERARLVQVQTQALAQAQQQFPQRLSQALDLQSHLGMPINGPANNMAKLMLQMRARHGLPLQLPQQQEAMNGGF